jgi:hypothetical protein
MPLVPVFNLRTENRLPEIEQAVRNALISMPEFAVRGDEVDLALVVWPDGVSGTVTRINVDLWEHAERTKGALQELATNVAPAFQGVCGMDQKVNVVIRPYEVGKSGWVSL